MADKKIIKRLTKAWMPWLFRSESPLSENEQSILIKRVEMIVDAYQNETSKERQHGTRES